MAKVPLRESLLQLYNPWIAVWELIKYVLFGLGVFSVPYMIASVFLRSSRLSDNGDILPEVTDEEGEKTRSVVPDLEIMPIAAQGTDILIPRTGIFTLFTTLVQPHSRGAVRLASGDPLDRPLVDLNFFSDPHDWITARKGVRYAMNMFEMIRQKRSYPCEPLLWSRETAASDRELDAYIKSFTRSGFHYSCTCRMAPELDPDQPGVVDHELRVHGVRNLRVCDTSIFPQIVSSHTMAPVVMVAEKCAEMIKRGSKH
jgi:choline dehydrogenase-like flavoprotein